VFAHANARSSFVTSAPIAATTSTVIRLMANHSQATLLQFISLRIEKGPLTARNGRATVLPGCLLLGGIAAAMLMRRRGSS
jgi:hypothetical protein